VDPQNAVHEQDLDHGKEEVFAPRAERLGVRSTGFDPNRSRGHVEAGQQVVGRAQGKRSDIS